MKRTRIKRKASRDRQEWIAARDAQLAREPSCAVCGAMRAVCVHHYGRRQGVANRDHDKVATLCFDHHTGANGVHTLGRQTFRARFGDVFQEGREMRMNTQDETPMQAIQRECAELFEQLDTACSLLATVGIAGTNADGYKCDNCGAELMFPDEFGHEDNHSSECDVPTVFALLFRIRRRMEKEALAKEVRG